MGLFNFSKKPPKNDLGERMDRLTPEGELPWGWLYANKEFTQKIESEHLSFSNAYYDSKCKGALKEYAALKSLIIHMKDVKRLCESQGECFSFWSTFVVSNPDDLASLEERLNYLEENMDELIKTETVITRLERELPEIIKAEPGILQTDIYKRYTPDVKHHISSILNSMENDGVIIREKSGRTYSLKAKGR